MVVIPRYIDDPGQLAMFEFDEVILLSVLFFLGVAGDMLGWCIAAMYFVNKAFVHIKSSSQRGLLMHGAYWVGIAKLKGPYGNSFDKYYGG
jgi:conjugal transfer pilus assembly protein TraL